MTAESKARLSEDDRKWWEILELVSSLVSYGSSCWHPDRGRYLVVEGGELRVERVCTAVEAREKLAAGSHVFDLAEDGRVFKFAKPAPKNEPLIQPKPKTARRARRPGRPR